jgi:hypothetical protein
MNEAKKLQAIIPWLPNPSRLPGLNWVYEWAWARTGTEPYLSEAPKNEPFNKAKAINAAARKFPDCILAICDADCVVCNAAFRAGVEAVRSNPSKLCLPHSKFKPMTPAQAAWFLETQSPSAGISGKLFPRRVGRRKAPGGLWLIDAELILANPVHEGFQGWGFEDGEFLDRVPYTRIDGPLFHIWHVPASRAYFNRNQRLRKMLNKQAPKP